MAAGAGWRSTALVRSAVQAARAWTRAWESVRACGRAARRASEPREGRGRRAESRRRHRAVEASLEGVRARARAVRSSRASGEYQSGSGPASVLSSASASASLRDSERVGVGESVSNAS
jgi:hypothetical protein